MEDIMWTADNWKDYEVIDTCGGEKLERWGQYILVRPDPHVDASKGMVGWAKENAKLSGLPETSVRWIVDDCQKFVEREIRRGNHYDAIIMDPPSYGRGPKGEIWKIETSIYPFIQLCEKLLSDNPLFFLVNSYTTGLQPAVLTYMLSTAVKANHGGHVIADEVGLPVSSNGLVLPCGASGRWEH